MALGSSRSTTVQLAAHPVLFLSGGIALLIFSTVIGLAWPVVLVALHFTGAGNAWPPLAVIVVITIFSPVLMYLFTFLPIAYFAEALILFALTWRSLRATDPLAPLVTREVTAGARYVNVDHYPLRRTRWTGLLESVRQTVTAISPWRRVLGFDLIWLAATAAGGLPWVTAPLLTTALVAIAALVGAGLLVWHRARKGRFFDKGAGPAKDPFGLTPAYYKGLAARNRARLRKVAAMKVAALAPGGRGGPAPTPFDLWVRAEAGEAFGVDPFIVLRIRKGDEVATAQMVDATFARIEQRMPKDELRAEVIEAAAFHRKKPVRKPKPGAKADPEPKADAKSGAKPGTVAP